MEYYGYAGSILYVDLANGETRKEPLDLELAKKFVGGWGINFKLAYDLMKPGTDPFSPDNPIIIGVGPLVGTVAPGAAKVGATTKFALPATEDGRYYITTASSGSRRFGLMLKNAGYDHVVITGRARAPVYIKIIDDEVEICDAGELWGKKDIYETTDELMDRYEGCGVIAIGRAGENLVRFAMALTDKKSTLGRSGLGAVMGSKNLKAIVTQGTKGIKISDQPRFMRMVDSIYEHFVAYLMSMHDPEGQAGWRDIIVPNLDPGIWSKYDWDARYGVKKVSEVRKEVKPCTSCWLPCGGGNVLEIKDGEFRGATSETGFYLVVAIVGQKLDLIEQREAIKLVEMMNRAGVCGCTSSSLIDWVTRRYKQNVITEKDTGGVVLGRDLNTYMELLDKIIDRQGFGNTLAEGWFETSRWVGRDARSDYVEGFGIAKGTDCIYPARAAKLDPMRFSMGITNPRGGHSEMGHSSTMFPLIPLISIRRDAEGWGTSKDAIDRIFAPVPYYGVFNTARLTRHIEDLSSIVSCLGACTSWAALGGLINATNMAELYSAATGIQIDPHELKRRGERVFNLYKVLNVREGFTRKDDQFPEVWLQPMPSPDGLQYLTDYYRMHHVTRDDLQRLLDDYYDERGWSIALGIPSREKLVELGLEEAIVGIEEKLES